MSAALAQLSTANLASFCAVRPVLARLGRASRLVPAFLVLCLFARRTEVGSVCA